MFNWLARQLARPFVANWIIARFAHDENIYYHIVNPKDETDIYMARWWILKRRPWMNFCIRLHWIKREDLDVNMHSHPFNYRTFILKNFYIEERPDPRYLELGGMDAIALHSENRLAAFRVAGQSIANTYGSFHRISLVHPKGVWTLFVMWGGAKDDWGFMTSSGYVQKDEYFANIAEKR